jgi:sigma-B regulation protein RsbU (phosphoserine phosphatase)
MDAFPLRSRLRTRWKVVHAATIALLAVHLASLATVLRRPYHGLVLRSRTVVLVDPGSPASGAGFRPGDEILAVGGSGTPRGTSLEAILDRAPSGVRVPVLVRRGEGRSTLSLVFVPPPREEVLFRAGKSLVALVALLLGFSVFRLRPVPVTFVFFSIGAIFSFVLRGVVPHGIPALYEGERLLANLAGFLLPALILHFTLLFPAEIRLARRRRWIPRLLYLPAGVLFLLTLLGEYAPGASAIEAGLYPAAALYFGLFVLGALVLFLAALVRAAPDERARLRVPVGGTVLGILPIAAVAVVRGVSPGIALPGERLAPMALLLLPASYGYAMVRHRIFGIEIIVKKSVVYFLLTAFLAAVYFGILLAIRHLLAGVAGGASVFVSVVSILVVAALFSGSRARIERIVDGLLFRERYELRERLRTFDANLASVAEPEALLGAMMESMAGPFRTEEAALYLADGGETFRRARRYGPAGRLPDPLALPERVRAHFRRTRSLLVPEEAEDVEDDALRADLRGLLESLGRPILLPVFARGDMYALVALRPRGRGLGTGREDLDLLRGVQARVSEALRAALHHQDVLSQERIGRELSLAREIQRHLLPGDDPLVPTVEFAGVTIPCEEVGGDYFDYVRPERRRIGLAVGDVSGKGVPAALLMARMQAAFRAEAERGAGPAAVASRLNLRVWEVNDREKFVSFFYGLLDLRARTITYTNAGLEAPVLVRREGKVELLQRGGLPLGVSAEEVFPEETLPLGRGDVLVCYTDGLTEIPTGERPMSIRRIANAVRRHRAEPARALRDRILAAAREARGGISPDDVTVVVAKMY